MLGCSVKTQAVPGTARRVPPVCAEGLRWKGDRGQVPGICHLSSPHTWTGSQKNQEPPISKAPFNPQRPLPVSSGNRWTWGLQR